MQKVRNFKRFWHRRLGWKKNMSVPKEKRYLPALIGSIAIGYTSWRMAIDYNTELAYLLGALLPIAFLVYLYYKW